MAILALDLGGTKLASAIFSESGQLLSKKLASLEKRKGREVGDLVTGQIKKLLGHNDIGTIGISVPGISRPKTGTVWAPNIEGWEDYPLLAEIRDMFPAITVCIDNDRACSIYGELWQGNAKGCRDAIFLAVGTGIGAGIVSGGNLITGSHDIAGAVGWMALPKPFHHKYIPCGCFEFYASGAGIPKFTREILLAHNAGSVLRLVAPEEITARHVFAAYEEKDEIASIVIEECISFWGMASANLVSIFNPEKIIFGGGIFGPAAKFIDAIKREASKWAQPISMTQVSFEQSALGGDAAVYGAGFLALKNISRHEI
jgi:glucokinase